MKLTVQDLQIGDYFDYLGKTIKVTSIYAKNGSSEVGFGNDEGCSVHIDVIKPIPTTQKIIKNNGFERITHVYPYPTYEYKNDKEKYVIRIAFPKGSKATKKRKPFVEIDEKNSWCTLDCEYIHQLQQIMRLCNIKGKEIELQTER